VVDTSGPRWRARNCNKAKKEGARILRREFKRRRSFRDRAVFPPKRKPLFGKTGLIADSEHPQGRASNFHWPILKTDWAAPLIWRMRCKSALKAAARGKKHRSALRHYFSLTDGLPTVGTRNSDEDRGLRSQKAGDARHLFRLGIGSDVNTQLLDQIAGGNALPFSPIRAGERRSRSTKFRVSIPGSKDPVLTHVRLEFGWAGAFRTTKFVSVAITGTCSKAINLVGNRPRHKRSRRR